MSVAYHLIGFNLALSRYDEGLPVYGAMRVLAGDLPQRDFWSMYPAGQFYTLAAVFSTMGASIMSERVWYVIVASALTTLLYVLARQMLDGRRALAVWIFGLIWVGSYRLHVNPALPGMLWITASVIAALSYHRTHSAPRLFLAGWCGGVAVLYRQDLGLGLLGIELVFILLTQRLAARNSERARASASPLWLAAGAALVTVPALVAMLVTTPWHVLWDDLFVFPARVFPAVRKLPVPAPVPDLALLMHRPAGFAKQILARLPYYFPMLVLLATGIMMIRRRGGAEWGAGLLWLVCAFLLVKGFVRTDLSNLMPAYVLLAVLTGWLLQHFSQTKGSSARVLSWLVIACAGVTVVVPLKNKLTMLSEMIRPSTYSVAMTGRARGIQVRPDDAVFAQVVGYVHEHVPPGEKIFVGTTHHDRLYTNDVMIYFLSERDAGTRFHELFPGLTTTEANQREIVADLEEHKVGWVVLREEHVSEPNQSSIASGVHVLDEFIRAGFIRETTFEDYSIWRRRP